MLSPDAELVLDMLDDEHVYCIGGLVDRSPKTGLSTAFAVRLSDSLAVIVYAHNERLAAEPPNNNQCLNLYFMCCPREYGDWK